MKTKEELNSLKEEMEALNEKLAELTEEELKQVVGGQITPLIDELDYMDPLKCGSVLDFDSGHVHGPSSSKGDYITEMESKQD